MIELLIMTLLCPVRVSSFVVHSPLKTAFPVEPHRNRIAVSNLPLVDTSMKYEWSPQDLTRDNPGFIQIPDDDYVKKYQNDPKLWPVEFFLIAYRRIRNDKTKPIETQILVRQSANGTSKYGVGTGVPATRWMISTSKDLPRGYQWSVPTISFEASNYPEFPKSEQQSWTYHKIDIREDAFNGPNDTIFNDPELEEYARIIQKHLKTKLSATMDDDMNLNAWKATRIKVVQNIVENANSVAAIQGTLRMSGLFQRKGTSDGSRYINLGKEAPDPAKLVQSMRIYTMFPQMPEPMPLPSTSPEELRKEIVTRDSRMMESGRDPHKDKYGRLYTHKSTLNVSNTIHGVYLTLDATDLPGLDDVPALDLFGMKRVKREWKSLKELKVLDSDGGEDISTEDPKPTFISGFIVRQLVKEKVIDIHDSS